MNQSLVPTNNEFEELIASMTEDEQRLALIFLIMYASDHPEMLTETARKELEEYLQTRFARLP